LIEISKPDQAFLFESVYFGRNDMLTSTRRNFLLGSGAMVMAQPAAAAAAFGRL